ncbi:MAG: M3 family metallopeptidase [Rhodobacteraceae bacterium]|nr:M3 family metallopeptidase [Paracoccaceae bacterium]MBL6639620.1 M3 family metallopeptidase [Paracoccaceae bacterium]MBL6675970.1 M3 family metallopeptidase [Paracoccaceae bacterium]MBL6788741.1 M3 family metallopeptidase [Paracoccaceae bacterium]MBL6860037.1 M3 family metallopeptidase [Paracoccaceae bacterium]
MSNPLLSDWTGAFGLAPFSEISDADFAPAFETALAEDLAETLAIANNPQIPSFANTIEALAATGKALHQVLSVFYTLSGADSNAAREALMREFSPKLSAHSSEIYANKALFGRIDRLWNSRAELDLSEEQQRVLMLTHRNFIRAGAALNGTAELRMKEIKSRLAVIGTEFSQNLLHDERSWHLELGPEDLNGLPEFLIDAAKAAGVERGVEAPIVTLSRSIIVPFLQFSAQRDLRKKAYQAWAARGAHAGAHDNRSLALEMLVLRQEMAELLGYPDFASFKLETEMAKTPENVLKLLKDVWQPAKARAEQDAGFLQDMMRAEGVNGDLEKWDWRYYAEKRRAAEFDLDEAQLKPYFQLDQMIAAAFDCANRLFGLSFEEVKLPLYHSDCRAWEVRRDGAHVALFIGDYFARGSKRSGAWCSAMRAQAKFPKAQAPIVINVCNFAKSDPALLSYDDARTLFHEFGHALHQMLSNVTYEMISGTSVPRDFVELPSQLYEHWLDVPEVLAKFATHAETGAAMPQDLLEKVLAAATYDMGFQTVEYVACAMVDLFYHTGDIPTDIMRRQTDILDQIDMPKAIGMRHATPQFAHVFSGGYYASAYYSYMWSEVMDADAFAAFEDKGDPFDQSLAQSLEENILAAGGSKDPELLYQAYRGRLPGVQALLQGRGLVSKALI